MAQGWENESERHSLASKGIKTESYAYHFPVKRVITTDNGEVFYGFPNNKYADDFQWIWATYTNCETDDELIKDLRKYMDKQWLFRVDDPLKALEEAIFDYEVNYEPDELIRLPLYRVIKEFATKWKEGDKTGIYKSIDKLPSASYDNGDVFDEFTDSGYDDVR